jgi:hypothetical protein
LQQKYIRASYLNKTQGNEEHYFVVWGLIWG